MAWKILLKRESLDVTTISMADKIFYDLIEKYMGEHGESMFSLYSNDFLTHYIKVDHNNFGIKLFRKKYNSPQKIKKYYLEGEKFLKNQKKIISDAKKLLKENKYYIAFKLFMKDYYLVTNIYSIGSWSAIEAWQNYFENELAKQTNQKSLGNFIEAIYKPWKKTALIKLQEEIKKGKNKKKLKVKYQFMGTWNLCWQKDFELNKVYNSILKNEKINKKNYSEIIKKLNLSKNLKKNIELLPYILFFKDYRDDIRRYHAHSWRFLFKAIADFFGLTLKELGYLTLNEIENSLKEKIVNYNLIKSRSKHEFILTMGSKKVMIVKQNISNKYKNIISKLNYHNDNRKKVKGFISQKGLIRGKAKIVNSFLDAKKVKKGDILIANVTHPEYLPAMHKASAIVTNEGGMISHAAIVARELNIPCIVGTKNATEIFKDGDLVEVDANKGVVKKL